MSQQIKKYEDYYFNEMEVENAAQFESELRENEAVGKEYDHFTLLMEILEKEIHDDLKSEMDHWENSYYGKNEENNGRIISLSKISAIAAALLLLIGFVFVNIFYSNNNIVKNNQTEYILSPSRSADNQQLEYFNMYDAYMRAEYEQVISDFDKINNTSKQYGEALLLKGKAHKKLEQYDKAIVSYRDAIQYFDNNNMDVSRERAEYEYTLLLLLSEGESKRFKAQLQSILDSPDHLYYKNAQELKSELSSFFRSFVI